MDNLGVASISIFLQGSFFSGNHQRPRGNSRFLKRTLVENSRESTPTEKSGSGEGTVWGSANGFCGDTTWAYVVVPFFEWFSFGSPSKYVF